MDNDGRVAGLRDVWSRICSVESLGRGLFFDLTVPGPANYLAEGLWNHNSGKTHGLIEKAIHVGWVNAPVPSMLVEPTFGMVTDNLLPIFEKILKDRRIRYRWVGPQGGGRKSSTITIMPGGGVPDYDILLRSADDPKRLDGKNLGFAGIDETGQCKPGTIDRVRRRLRDPNARVRQLLITGTPENLGEYYEWAEGNPQKGTSLVRAKTHDNIFLPSDYSETNLSHLDEDDREQYMLGRFITRGSRAYRAFDAGVHGIPCERIGNVRVDVGADFNVGKMSWVCSKRNGADELHVFSECIGWDTTTEDQGERLTRHLQGLLEAETGRPPTIEEVRRRTTIHTDPSAKNRSVRASRSDVQQLRDMGFEVRCSIEQIPVKDRMASVNWRFKDPPRLFVDPRCTLLTKALKQQMRDANGDPVKDKDPKKDLSAETDALGYLVWGLGWRASSPKGNTLTIASYV
jgi:hypothetical protein